MIFTADDVVILLGAGASKDAGLPTSVDMIEDVERCLCNLDQWKAHQPLYNCIKSSIFYGDGIKGDFAGSRGFNIERLVNTIRELEKKEDHAIYPFVASWNMKLVELTNGDFSKLAELRDKIIARLFNSWIRLKQNEKASYFSGVERYQAEWGYPLRIFTLNYDLCVETTCRGIKVERGFGPDDRLWDWRRLEDDEHTEAQIYLYKMHGSIDWRRNADATLTFDDTPRTPDNLAEVELIFGTDYKLSYIDPYLYMAYSFRRYTLAARLIMTVGYGFGDEHINSILSQALKQDAKRKLLAVTYQAGKAETDITSELSERLRAQAGQVVAKNQRAEEFLGTLNNASLAGIFPRADDSPF